MVWIRISIKDQCAKIIMAQEYSFTQQERNNFSHPTKVYSSFGRDQLNDFMMLHVYDMDGNFSYYKSFRIK